jgi:hypothetical protein
MTEMYQKQVGESSQLLPKLAFQTRATATNAPHATRGEAMNAMAMNTIKFLSGFILHLTYSGHRYTLHRH